MENIGELVDPVIEAIRAKYRTGRKSSASKPLCQCQGIGWVRGERGLEACVCHREAHIADLRRHKGVPEIYAAYRIDDFHAEYYGKAQAQKAHAVKGVLRRFADEFMRIERELEGRGLYMTSSTRGSGKTLAACILVNELVNAGVQARFFGMSELLGRIKDGYDPESNESSATVINTARNARVLVLDDIGVERQTPWVQETVYRILDSRLGAGKTTIFTSNAEMEALNYDERIIDRIRRMAYVVRFPEESVRRKLALVEDERMRAILGGCS